MLYIASVTLAKLARRLLSVARAIFLAPRTVDLERRASLERIIAIPLPNVEVMKRSKWQPMDDAQGRLTAERETKLLNGLKWPIP